MTKSQIPNPKSQTPLEWLKSMHAQAHLGGGSERIERQHARDKMTARERLDVT